jgi:hypothetical protein
VATFKNTIEEKIVETAEFGLGFEEAPSSGVLRVQRAQTKRRRFGLKKFKW